MIKKKKKVICKYCGGEILKWEDGKGICYMCERDID